MTVFEKGVVSPPEPASSVRPGGLVANESATVLGCRTTLAIPEIPSAFVAESCRSR
jgi:hypothetical protein